MSHSRFKRSIIILMDGARPDVIFEMMARGELPHLKALSENGTRQKMVSCFPSTTGPAYLPYMTGCFPGTCNIPGIRWFDKPTYAQKGWGFKSFRSYCGLETYYFDSDMNPAVRTAWEFFDKPLSIYNGVTKHLPRHRNPTFIKRTSHIYYAHLTDHWDFVDKQSAQMMKDSIRKKDFDFAFMVFPGVDEYSHRSAVRSDRVLQAYRDIDSHIGEIMTELKNADLHDETALTVVSDHGLSDTHGHFDVGPWLESDRGLKTFYYTNIFKFHFDAVSMVSGNGMAHLYFKGDKGWKERLSFEEISHKSILLDILRSRPEVALVITQGADGSIHMQNEVGHGWFSVNSETQLITYKFDKKDPLGIFENDDERLTRGFTFDESLQLSFESYFPDVFCQLYQVLKSPRSGDIMISARSGYDFRVKFEHPIHKASHGSLCPEHMHIPLITNYPVTTPFARSVDVFPTLMTLLGKEIPPVMDGRVIV